MITNESRVRKQLLPMMMLTPLSLSTWSRPDPPTRLSSTSFGPVSTTVASSVATRGDHWGISSPAFQLNTEPLFLFCGLGNFARNN